MAAIGTMAISRISTRAALLSVQSALDAAPVAMSYFDHEQRLVFWNRPCADLLQIILGVDLPDMSGLEAMGRIRKADPNAVFVFASLTPASPVTPPTLHLSDGC